MPTVAMGCMLCLTRTYLSDLGLQDSHSSLGLNSVQTVTLLELTDAQSAHHTEVPSGMHVLKECTKAQQNVWCLIRLDKW